MLSGPGKVMLLKQHLAHLDVATLDDRLVMQKTVYLLQQLGLDLGYRFAWYLRGPYSRALAADAFQALQGSGAAKDYGNEAENYRFTEASLELIDKHKRIIGKRQEEAEWLEMLSSLVFVRNALPRSRCDEELVNTLVDEKPKYSEKRAQLEEAMGLVKAEFSTVPS